MRQGMPALRGRDAHSLWLRELLLTLPRFRRIVGDSERKDAGAALSAPFGNPQICSIYCRSHLSRKKRAALLSAAVKSKGGNARGVCTGVQDQIYAAMHNRARDRLPQGGNFM